METEALFHIAPRQVEVRKVRLVALGPDQVLVQSLCSAISPGTEKRLFVGDLPENMLLDANLPALRGTFSYPFRYGYALVGQVVAAGSEARHLIGQRVFLFHPHQRHVLVAARECLLLPHDVPVEDALFFANLESAVNFVHDATPVLGEVGLVIGLGVVGLLTVAVLARFPLQLYACDPIPERRRLAEQLGAITFAPSSPAHLERGFDFSIELSGEFNGLQQAVEWTGFCGRLVVGSWYNRPSPLDLGGAFHRSRLRWIVSQVSTIDPVLSGRWDKKRRYELVWKLIRELKPSCFISHRFPLSSAQEVFERLERGALLQPIFVYGE